jgi:hypothetical protein
MRQFSRHAIVFGLISAAVLSIGLTRTAFATTPYDGIWSVSIVTERGECDRGYRYPVAIVNGRVMHADQGDQSFMISGQVNRGGAVRVNVRRGGQWAEGAGRLSMSAGQGQWRSPSSNCYGYWTAERRS